MPRQKTILKLDPNRCTRCGRCVPACEPGALKVGASYIYVDWRACNQCGKCIDVCEPGAIVRRDVGAAGKGAAGKGAAVKGSPAKKAAAVGARSAARAKPTARATTTPKPKPRAKPGGPARTSEVPVWTLLEAFAILAVVFAAFMLKDALLNSSWADSMRPTALVWLRVIALAVFYAIQIGALLLLARYRGVELVSAMRMGRVGTTWKSKSVSSLMVVGLLLATRIAAWVYGMTAQALGWSPPVVANSNLTDIFGPDRMGLALSVLMVVVVGPVIEEMVFRGLLLPAFDARMGRWLALGISSALFAGYHFNAWLFVPAFTLGLATGWLSLHRDSLWPAIALHSLYNVVPVVMAFYVVS